MVTALACLACLVTRDATPESTVRGMVDAFNNHDWKGALSRFEGAKVDQVVPIFEKIMANPSADTKFFVKTITLTTTGDTAAGPVNLGIQTGSRGGPSYHMDEVHLHLTNGDWKIVKGANVQSIFDSLAGFATDPEKIEAARKAGQRTVVLSDMKQIALGVLMYANDWDDKVTFTQANMKAKLQPYLKNEKLWIGPDGKPLDVRINPNLVGKSMSSIAEPTITVMLSLGAKDGLVFVDDRTPIAFADGHVKYMTKGAIGSLKWK